MIESCLEEFIGKFNREDLNRIRRAMARYALDAVHDQQVRNEAEWILGINKKEESYGQPQSVSETSPPVCR